MRKSLVTLSGVVSLALSAQTLAFTVKSIEYQGLQRIHRNTVDNYLPVEVGESLNTEKSREILRVLYETGFFQDVELLQDKDTLVVKVVERATIASVDIKGSSALPYDKLLSFLKDKGISQGQVYRRDAMEQIKHQLTQEYNNRGKYNATVTAKVVSVGRNRVAVKLIISEGRVAKIKSVNIIGNTAFSDWTLKRQMPLSRSGLFTFLTGSDTYSKAQLDQSLEALRNYYLNAGYLKFRVESNQVLLSPDRKRVYITIKVTEGPKYTFAGFNLVGNLILPRQDLRKLVPIKRGETFMRDYVNASVERVGAALANRGYGYPKVTAEPQIDEQKHTVFMTFYVEPGRHMYVRRVNFHGNTKTAEYVLRNAMRQQEGELMRLSKIKESKRQLSVLPYLEEIVIHPEKVAGTNNQVDLDVYMKETSSAEIKAQIAVSRVKNQWNPTFSVGLNQRNFMGTGKTAGFDFSSSRTGQNYSISYYDPFLTANDVGGGGSLYYQRSTPEKLGFSAFSTNKWGADSNLNFVLSDHSSLQLGLGFQHLQLRNVDLDGVAPQLKAFARTNGTDFNHIRLSTGYSYNNYNTFPYPSKGMNFQINGLVALPADGDSLSYYKASASSAVYIPLTKGFILKLKGHVGYGNRFDSNGLPFFENYFAGGIATPGTVRGFTTYDLGPLDVKGNPLGGNLLVGAMAGLILPYPLSQGPFRTMVFIDSGNVYSFDLPADQRGSKSGPYRFSSGVAVDWRSPFGPITLSAGWPLKRFSVDNVDPTLPPIIDRTTVVQFTMSSSI